MADKETQPGRPSQTAPSGSEQKWRRFIPKIFFTLKFRLMLLITLALLIVVGAPLIYLSTQFDRSFENFSVEMIETASNAVYQSIFDGFMENDPEHIQENLQILATDPGIELIRIYALNGKIIFSSRPEEINHNIFEIRLADSVRIIPTPDQGLFIKYGDHYSHQHPIYVHQECAPCHTNVGEIIGTIDVQIELAATRYLMERSKKLTIASAVVIIFLLWVVLNFLYRGQIEAKLGKIIRGFQELSRGNMNYRIDMRGQHELAELAQYFNRTVDKLRQAQEREKLFIQSNLERADRLVTLGEVAAEIAHEVNNPAGIILIRAELLREELAAKNVDPDILEDLESIIKQTKRIAESTKHILHYARKRPHTEQAIDLNAVVEQSLKVLQPRIKKRRATVEVTKLPRQVVTTGDFSQMEQVFCNLINNSLDVLPKDKGKITIDMKYCDGPTDSPHVRIAFSDNGPGIPPEIRDQIFAPFYTTKQDDKGTGLGLFIVRNIIANHGGRIYLANPQPEHGACFIIEVGVGNGKS